MKQFSIYILILGTIQSVYSQDLNKCKAFKLNTTKGNYYTYNFRTTAFYRDKEDNYYIGTYKTRKDLPGLNNEGCEFMVLNKYTNKGELDWSFDMQDYINNYIVWYSSTYINGIVTDDSGFVYVAASCAGAKAQLGNIQLGSDTYNYYTKFLVFKLDPRSMKVVWAIYGTNTEPSFAGDIILNGNSLYVSYWKHYTERLAMTANNNTFDMEGDIGILEISKSGSIIKNNPLKFTEYQKTYSDYYYLPENMVGIEVLRCLFQNYRLKKVTGKEVYLSGITSTPIISPEGFKADPINGKNTFFNFKFDVSINKWTNTFNTLAIDFKTQELFYDQNQYLPNIVVAANGDIIQTVFGNPGEYSQFNTLTVPGKYDNLNLLEGEGYIFCFSNSGKIKWQKKLSSITNIKGIHFTRDSSLVVLGNYKEKVEYENQLIIQGGNDRTDVFLITIDKNGNYINSTKVEGLLNERLNGSAYSNKKNTVAVLIGSDYIPSYQGVDLFEESESDFLIELGNCEDFVTGTVDNKNEAGVTYYDYQNHKLIFKDKSPSPSKELIIHDLSGNIVIQKILYPDQTSFSLDYLMTGFYVVTIKSSEGIINYKIVR